MYNAALSHRDFYVRKLFSFTQGEHVFKDQGWFIQSFYKAGCSSSGLRYATLLLFIVDCFLNYYLWWRAEINWGVSHPSLVVQQRILLPRSFQAFSGSCVFGHIEHEDWIPSAAGWEDACEQFPFSWLHILIWVLSECLWCSEISHSFPFVVIV